MPITLSTLNPEVRSSVGGPEAKELVASWEEQLKGGETCDTICLRGKTYTPEAAKIIADFLTSTENGQASVASGVKVALIDDIIASQHETDALEVLTTISDAFKESKLVEVDLSDNAMGTKGVVACKSVLSGPAVSETLQKLRLCNNGLSKYTMDEVQVLLTEGESSCIAKNLTQVHFFNNMSDDAGCGSFKKIISCSENLTDIRFSGTRAKAAGSADIASGLKDLAESGNLGNIVRLDLADNSFGDCYEDLAEALKVCSKLEFLDIHDCCLGDDGIVAVCEALIEAKAPLTFLSISGCDIGADGGYEGASAVGKLIASISGSIESFNASENEIKSPGIRTIARAFKSDTVKQIYLNMNEIGSVGGNALVDMAAGVPNLEVIEINENGFVPDIVDRLTEVYGDKLVEMEDNIDDEDYDDELDEEELKDSADAEVDDLADLLKKQKL